MNPSAQPEDTLIDFITGRTVPNAGAEINRQAIAVFLVEVKGYDRKDIEVDAAIALDMDGQHHRSSIDLVVRVNGFKYMVIKCAAGSLVSREREVIAAARLLDDYQIPLSIASDGDTAIVWDTISGKLLGEGLEVIPSKSEAAVAFDPATVVALEKNRRDRQMLIYRTYATQSCGTANPQQPSNK